VAEAAAYDKAYGLDSVSLDLTAKKRSDFFNRIPVIRILEVRTTVLFTSKKH
jgi:hypothetical protein